MSDKPSILILGLNYAPEAIGIGPYTTGLAEHLAAQGHRVKVIAGWPYYPEWAVKEGSGSWWESTCENSVEVIRCPHYVPSEPTRFRRLLHHASFALSSLPVMLEAAFKKPQIICAVMPSLIAAPVAWVAARLAGAKLWLHVQDFEVDAALATGLATESSIIARAGHWLEKALFGNADLVTTISPQMCARLAQKGVPIERIAEMRNWANHLDDIGRADGSKLREEWNLGGKFVALYSGNIANKQGLEVVIDAARELSETHSIAFVICGSGPNLKRLKDRSLRLTNIQFRPLQPPERFAQLMKMADCHLLPQVAGAADLVLPSKLANMLASGRPIIATANADTGIADEIDGCGEVVAPGDAKAFAAAIADLAGDLHSARRLGMAGKARAREHWARKAIMQTTDRLVAGLT
ncbi:WcaI family glycosyltransferase [Altererythrobacter sp. MF3-039]|uniref:WcaI family glycosyltransferase n=1 Tax=Altererythrobacter sp. MF3-039 TaxID=3252901 RepID=UPI00390CB3FB